MKKQIQKKMVTKALLIVLTGLLCFSNSFTQSDTNTKGKGIGSIIKPLVTGSLFSLAYCGLSTLLEKKSSPESYKKTAIGSSIAFLGGIGLYYAFTKGISLLKNTINNFKRSYTQEKYNAREEFFFDIMNIEEYKFKNDSSSIIKNSIQKDGDNFFIKKNGSNTRYQAGNFKTFTLKELQEKAKQKLNKNGKNNNETFNLIVGVGTTDYNDIKRHVDIGAMQADPENKDAVFQVASNFNALELIRSDDSMEDITGYTGDPTQGPAASISAAPGLIYRHYYYYRPENPSENEDATLWRQTPTKQLNLLENTGIPVTNSYIDLSKMDLGSYKEETLYNNFKIAYHKNIQVTFGFVPNQSGTQVVVNNKDQIIHQAFTAAVDLKGQNSSLYNNETAIKIAQAILDCGYEATLKAAYVDDKKKVFLTLVGCGVFENEPKWVYNAIQKQIKFIKDSGLNVTLVIYDKENLLKDDLDNFKKLVQETGGIYEEYTSF